MTWLVALLLALSGLPTAAPPQPAPSGFSASNEVLRASQVDGGSSAASLLPEKPSTVMVGRPRYGVDLAGGVSLGGAPVDVKSDQPRLRSGPTSATGAPLSGKASYVGQRYGSRYLALPGGPGIRVRICSSKACVLRVSTDAGPDKAMQREGRIADVSYADFRTLCRCRPESVGLLRVTITTGGPALPQTDVEPVK